MNNCAAEHPAVRLGAWLENKRRAKDMVAREFADKVWLTPAKYAELELGIGCWIGSAQMQLIPLALELSDDDTLDFKELVNLTSQAPRRGFSDHFSREDLTPVRAFHHNDRQLTERMQNQLLDQIFKPLA